MTKKEDAAPQVPSHFTISTPLLEAIIAYLGTGQYQNVHQMLGGLQIEMSSQTPKVSHRARKKTKTPAKKRRR